MALEGKKKIVATLFDTEKAYDKVNSRRIFEKLENMRIHSRMLETINELVKEMD